MFLKRYYITAGATTTAGGVVRASSKHSRINGAFMVLEGDPIDCPACGGQGVVKCVMPRIRHRLDGKEYALSDDLCICGCNPPPKINANQTFKAQYALVVDDDSKVGAVEQQGQDAGKVHGVESAKRLDLRPLRFVIRGTGRPHANQPYRLTLADGRVVQGVTDATGATRLLTPDERAALRTWQSGER